MKINNKLLSSDVVVITKDFCNLLNGCENVVIRENIELFDEKGNLNEYTTMLCVKEKDKEKAQKEIKEQRGDSIKNFHLDNEYCHIATYQNDNKNDYEISFDENEECMIHANFNKEYKNIEEFFKRFIRFRNGLTLNKEVVKDDDCYQYFLSVKRGFGKKVEKNKQKIFRIK